MLDKKFFLYIVSFLDGIIFHSIFLSASLSSFTLFFLISISFIFYFSGKYFRVLSLLIIFFLLGFLRFSMTIDYNQKHVLDYFAKEKKEIVLEGKIINKPIYADGVQKFQFATEALVLGENAVEVSTKIFVKANYSEKLSYGEKILLKTIPRVPDSFTTEGGRVFNYKHFLEKDNIYYIAKTSSLHVLEKAPHSLLKILYDLKDKLLMQIYRYIPRPESSLLAGILLGEKTALGNTLEQEFRTTGLMHIVVLSGYNVSLIIIAVSLMLSFLPVYTRSIISIFLIVAFALLVGAGPTVIRASIMALFIVLGRIIGRPHEIIKSLIIAGLLMLVYNPWVLYYDISFQFSFLATLGLILLMPILEKKLFFIPRFFDMRESAAATLSAQIMVMPLIVYYIGDFSIISLVVNMLVLFMVPVSMAFGFLTAIFAFFSPFFASIFAFPTTLSLKYILSLVHFFANVPFAKFFIHKFSFLWIIFYYLILFFFIFRKKKKFGQE